ncbi:MAG TPA: hypothetical protein VFC39_06665 [Acidobacteriaceae bacterium]|nr:hypothetical protein [Acidobacteriaceae bacterium]
MFSPRNPWRCHCVQSGGTAEVATAYRRAPSLSANNAQRRFPERRLAELIS